jgi:hypothetical protein
MKNLKLLLWIFIFLILIYCIYLYFFNENNVKIQSNDTEPAKNIVTQSPKIISDKNEKTKTVIKSKTVIIVKEEPKTVKVLDIKILPKNISDVNITPKLQDFFNKYWDGSTEKIDFRLKLFDRLSQCLGPKAPTSGKITMSFLFKSDIESKTAIGIDARDDDPLDQQVAFQIKKSTLSSDDEEIFNLCIREAHVGLYMNISDKMNKDNGAFQEYFYHPISIQFPIESDIIYWLLSHEGESPQ